MHYEGSIVIDRPADEGWAFLSDFFNSPRLRPGFLGWRSTSPGPLGAGSTAQGRVVILGFETRLKARIIEWDPPRGMVMTMTGRPINAYRDRMTLEVLKEGTKVSRSTELDPSPMFKPLLALYWPFFERQQRAVFENAKRILEAGSG